MYFWKVNVGSNPTTVHLINIAPSPSGKARDFDSLIRWSESIRGSRCVFITVRVVCSECVQNSVLLILFVKTTHYGGVEERSLDRLIPCRRWFESIFRNFQSLCKGRNPSQNSYLVWWDRCENASYLCYDKRIVWLWGWKSNSHRYTAVDQLAGRLIWGEDILAGSTPVRCILTEL